MDCSFFCGVSTPGSGPKAHGSVHWPWIHLRARVYRTRLPLSHWCLTQQVFHTRKLTFSFGPGFCRYMRKGSGMASPARRTAAPYATSRKVKICEGFCSALSDLYIRFTGSTKPEMSRFPGLPPAANRRLHLPHCRVQGARRYHERHLSHAGWAYGRRMRWMHRPRWLVTWTIYRVDGRCRHPSCSTNRA